MAGWLSSKLKEAENFLQQIDQQAAESLGKPEKEKHGGSSNKKRGLQGNLKPMFDPLLADQRGAAHDTGIQSKQNQGSVPLAHAQFKQMKKHDQIHGVIDGNLKGSIPNRKKQPDAALHINANSTGKDDWTELLASPNADPAMSPALASSVGSSDSVRAGYGNQSSQAYVSKPNRIGRLQRSNDNLSERFSRSPGMTSKSIPSTSSSNIATGGSQSMFLQENLVDKTLKRRLENDLVGLAGALVVPEASKGSSFKHIGLNGINGADNGDAFAEGDRANGLKVQQEQWEHCRVSTSVSKCDNLVDNVSDKIKMGNEAMKRTSSGRLVEASGEDLRIEGKVSLIQRDFGEALGYTESVNGLAINGSESGHVHEDAHVEELKETRASPASSPTEEESYDSGSMSDENSGRRTVSEEDEEIERRKSAQKKRIARRKELSAARAAKAQVAIREREVLVEKLEKEVVSLQHILTEREEQQGKEAAELRTSIAEVMQALETEKKLHSSTRMKALSVESLLENENADFAKSLGALQWELEEEVSQVLKARSLIGAKESVITDLEKRLAKARFGFSFTRTEELKYGEKAKQVDYSFEEEQSDLWKKIQQCQIQAKDLEVKISGLKDSWQLPTEPEKELQSRLSQLTDHLIQKQSQVEALSAERATLLIRLESLINTVEEERGLMASQASRSKNARRNLHWDPNYDVEHALGRSYDSKGKPFLHENGDFSAPAAAASLVNTSFSPVLRQLNGLVSAGFFYVRRHRWAQAVATMYIIVLHLWVWFLLFKNSKPAQRTPALQELGLPKNVIELKNASNITNLL